MTKSVQRYLSKNNYDIFAASDMQEKFADWYLKQKKPCSFLSNNSCSIYEQRPIACREHLIVNTDISCSYEDHNDGNTLEVPISIRQALKVLTCNLEMTTMESIVLPCIFDWYKLNTELSNRTWAAATMAKRFVNIVKAMEEKK
jgi:Fe-S-cluster containining protein